jgi:FKBP-type peptidyl-prolyl cis-trans isomerase FkpA
MATTRSQRWGILAILVVTVVGTLGSFAVMILANDNQAKDAARQQELSAKYQADYKGYQAKVDAQSAQLSKQYYDEFKQYTSQVSAFDRDSVKELNTEDITVGDGAAIDGTTKFAAYYIGWNPKGKIFDQSINGEALKAPLPIADGLDNASLIPGWKEGMKGMKIGGVRVLTIPSDKAYGEQGQGDDIPANTPLKFVVMAIPLPEQFTMPQFPQELMQAY